MGRDAVVLRAERRPYAGAVAVHAQAPKAPIRGGRLSNKNAVIWAMLAHDEAYRQPV